MLKTVQARLSFICTLLKAINSKFVHALKQIWAFRWMFDWRSGYPALSTQCITLRLIL